MASALSSLIKRRIKSERLNLSSFTSNAGQPLVFISTHRVETLLALLWIMTEEGLQTGVDVIVTVLVVEVTQHRLGGLSQVATFLLLFSKPFSEEGSLPLFPPDTRPNSLTSKEEEEEGLAGAL